MLRPLSVALKNVARGWDMVAYEFYQLDPTGGYQIIGILPERRKNPARINQESIMERGKGIFGEFPDSKDIFFLRVIFDENTIRVFRPVPITVTQ